MESMRSLHGIHETLFQESPRSPLISESPFKLYVESMKTPCGLVGSSRNTPSKIHGLHRLHIESPQSPHGLHLDSIRSPWKPVDECKVLQIPPMLKTPPIDHPNTTYTPSKAPEPKLEQLPNNFATQEVTNRQ